MSDQSQPDSGHRHGFPVVGIGASAGGIHALREFFSRVEPDSGMAYVVILHLSAQHESNLPALLQSIAPLPVTQVTETVEVQPNHIYVIPPSKYLMMLDGKIRLTEPERPRGSHTSIDLFFRTLAAAFGKDAVAVLLSGTGNDGTIGLGRIKEEGGFALVQDPAEAEYGDMPRSAIEASLADVVLPVVEMPAKLRAMLDGGRRMQLPPDREEQPAGAAGVQDSEALREVLIMLRQRTGNDFSQYKRPTLLRRIARRMQVHELMDIPSYLGFLHEHPDEVSALFHDLLITVTNFFRDRESFELLSHEVIPQLFVGKGTEDQVRVWSPGCATGEEAYSLAMLLSEHADGLPTRPFIQVFATDVDERAIAEAREGIYPATISLDVSPERLRRFFTRHGDHYQVKKELREIVLFAPHNVLRDPPFSRMDLISCRNLLIYLNREMQDRLFGIMHFALRPDGYLFLGSSESAEGAPSLFMAFDKKHRIYKRRDFIGIPRPVELLPGHWQARSPETAPANLPARARVGELHQEVVEQLAPPSVLVNEEFDILHISARAGRYLRFVGGEPSRNLLKVVLPELRLDLRSALLEAQARHGSTETSHLRVDIDGTPVSMILSVSPVADKPPEARGCFLVTFNEVKYVAPPGSAEAAQNSEHDGHLQLVQQLEDELQRTKDQLRTTVEQYETSTEELRASNEELQAINEELRSATEELETSKEELQSVNEELTTVNQEYREKIEEVGRANSDLQNLMASTEIATIFLDRALQIKRFTPTAAELFNITNNDIGRPLEHFTGRLNYAELTRDAERVLRQLQPLEREVHSNHGRWYLARFSPYRTIEDKIDGVVLTFIDITTRKESEERLRAQTPILMEQTAILNLAHVLITDEKRQIVFWNPGCEQLYGYPRGEAIGKNAAELLKTEYPAPFSAIEQQLQKNGDWEGELIRTTRAGGRIAVAAHLILHKRAPEEPPVILEVNSDVTALRAAEQVAREADRNKDHFLAVLGHELRNPLSAMLVSVSLLRQNHADSALDARVLEIVERQVRMLARLVNDLLDIQRLTKGKISLQKENITLSQVIDGALDICRPQIDSATHRFSVVLPKEPIALEGDLVRLEQIVSNLLLNAFKYTPPGGTVELRAEQRDGQLFIRVRDSGIGISREMLPRIFDAYYQGEPLSDAAPEGLGVGLALVRHLTELHGGSVDAASEGPGKGSEFTVRIPIGQSQPAGQKVAQRGKEKPNDKVSRKILIVDDNRDSADAMAMLLEMKGHTVRTAYDSRVATKVASEFKPEFAILDIGLPGLDGFELAKALRGLVPGVALLALSGWRIDPNEPKAREAGFQQFITKPPDMELLDDLLAQTPRSSKRRS